MSLPQVKAFPGDPRLEPIPSTPIHVPNVTVFGEGRQLQLRFPPRVNGQNHSDGDGHADLFAFFDAATGLPIPGQLPVVEAVPFGAAPSVSELDARIYSAIWEMHAVTMRPTYDPNDPAQRIDSAAKVFQSPLVDSVYQTNIFLNCPVLPNGSTVDPGSLPPERALYNGSIVTLAPYDIEDGISHPQVLFRFEDHAGHTLPSDAAPHLVLSRIPGMPFYSSIWEVWSVTVPTGFPVETLRSVADVKNTAFPIHSAKVRLDCPVVAVESAPDSGTFTPMPFENAFDLLRNDFRNGIGRFQPQDFLVDVPTGMRVAIQYDPSGAPIGRTFVPSPFHFQRGFRITEKVRGGGAAAIAVDPPLSGLAQRFPRIASIKGNFAPVILRQPFPMTSPDWWPRVSSPDSTGEIARFTQQELDSAYLGSVPPQLPPQIEKNIDDFIQNGLMDPSWSPGRRPYIERLALVGRALHEFVWQPEQGIQSIDTTSCVACHATPASGSGSRSLYNVIPRAGGSDGPVLDTINGGSMWGGAGAELIVDDRRLRGLPTTEAHASTGDRDTLRHFSSKAQNAHFGIQSLERIVEATGCSIAAAATMDLDGDGVVNEATVGEVTAQAAYLLNLPVPGELRDRQMRTLLGVTDRTVDAGRVLFRRSLARGGAGCAACHTPFLPLPTTTKLLTNPETAVSLPITVAHHAADALDVADGYASALGQPGLRLYGDFRFHKMGAAMRSVGLDAPDTFKTAELWDAGSAAPYLRDGSAGMDLRAAIVRHAGVSRSDVALTFGPQTQMSPTQRQQVVTLTNRGIESIPASPAAPLRVIVIGPMQPMSALAQNTDGLGPDGQRREGSFWVLTEPIAPGQSVDVLMVFQSGSNVSLQLTVQDHNGFSEAAAVTAAFLRLRPTEQASIVDFLKVQTINGQTGEGSGGIDLHNTKAATLQVGGDQARNGPVAR